MALFDSSTVKNMALAAPVGAAGGALLALLQRKADIEQLKRDGGFSSPERTVTLPTLRRPIPVPEKTGAFGHAVGVIGGGVGGYHVLNKLMVKKHTALLDAQIAQKDKTLNDLLLQEQSLAAGLPQEKVAMLTKAANFNKLDTALVKIASKVYDLLEKRSDLSLSDLFGSVTDLMRVGKNPFFQALMTTSGLAGGLYGYHMGAKGDPARMMSKAVKESLKERLTGKDQLMGPMPLRVETETPSMTPIRPGASSLVDPTKGRDVLEGI